MTPDELRAARLRLGLTQEQLARRLGVTVSAVSHWEQGVRRVPAWLERMLPLLELLDWLKRSCARSILPEWLDRMLPLLERELDMERERAAR